jgi:hypothetical protein
LKASVLWAGKFRSTDEKGTIGSTKTAGSAPSTGIMETLTDGSAGGFCAGSVRVGEERYEIVGNVAPNAASILLAECVRRLAGLDVGVFRKVFARFCCVQAVYDVLDGGRGTSCEQGWRRKGAASLAFAEFAEVALHARVRKSRSAQRGAESNSGELHVTRIFVSRLGEVRK